MTDEVFRKNEEIANAHPRNTQARKAGTACMVIGALLAALNAFFRGYNSPRDMMLFVLCAVSCLTGAMVYFFGSPAFANRFGENEDD